MKLTTFISDSFSLDMGNAEEVDGAYLILPPETSLLDQLLVWLKDKPDSHTMPSPETMGVGLTALCLRWGTYLAFLADENKPLDPDAKDKTINMISNDEMMRMNIESSHNLARLLKMLHEDKDSTVDLILRAYDRLPFMRNKIRANKSPIHPFYKNFMHIASGLPAAFPLDPKRVDFANHHAYRMFANIMMHTTYRNGPIEDIHAGRYAKPYSLDKRRFPPRQAKELERFTAESMANMLQAGCPWDILPVNWELSVAYLAVTPFMYPSDWSVDQSSSTISDIEFC